MKTKRMQGICIYVAILFVAFLLLEIYGEVIDLINDDETVLLDIIDGGAGSCYVEGESTRNIDSENACNAHSASHEIYYPKAVVIIWAMDSNMDQ